MTKAGEIISDLFGHVARAPKHRDICVIHPMGFGLGWRFKCLECSREWHIKHMDLIEDPITAKLIRDGYGPAKLLDAMMKLPFVTSKPNAWDRVTDGFLDDDS